MRGQRKQLNQAQVNQAKQLWQEGKSLGQIAKQLDCSTYALSPWLYKETIEQAREDALRSLAKH